MLCGGEQCSHLPHGGSQRLVWEWESLKCAGVWFPVYWKGWESSTGLQTPRSQLLLVNRALPESARWLLTQGRIEEARQLVQKAASVNRRKISLEFLNQVLPAGQGLTLSLKLTPTEPLHDPSLCFSFQLAPEKTASSGNALDLFRHPHLRKVTLILICVW